MRAAIVGAGLMGRWHAHAVTHSGHRVSAIVDSDAVRARGLASEYAGSVTYSALCDVGADVDVVHVCTPSATHVAIVSEALTRGYHVLAEKPLADTLAETRALLALAESRDRLLVPVLQYAFQRGALQASSLLPSMGSLLHFDAVMCSAGADGQSAAVRDRAARHMLPHALSLMTRLVSPDLASARWTLQHSRPGELRVGGVLGNASISALVSTGGRPTDNTLRLICEGGTIYLDLFHGFAMRTRGRVTRAYKLLHPFLVGGSILSAATGNLTRRVLDREPAYPGLRELVRRFYHAASTGGAAPISSADTLAVATVIDWVAAEMANAAWVLRA